MDQNERAAAKPADFTAQVLFEERPRFTAAGLAARVASRFPALAAVEVAGRAEIDGAASLGFADGLVWVATLEQPVARDQLQPALDASTPEWPGVRGHLAGARVQVGLRASLAAEDPAARRRLAQAVAAVASALCALPGARAALCPSARRLLAPEHMIAETRASFEGGFGPWVAYDVAERAGGSVTARTRGLAAFGLAEIALEDLGLDIGRARKLAQNAALRALEGRLDARFAGDGFSLRETRDPATGAPMVEIADRARRDAAARRRRSFWRRGA